MFRFRSGSLTGKPFLLLLVAGVAVKAAANGGPVHTEPAAGGRGTILPLEETSVRLVSERLRITLVDVYAWRARAEYVLANPGPPRAVLFGVPTSWARSAFLDTGPQPSDSIIEGAREISITLAGKTLTCSPELAAEGKSPPGVEVWCVVRMVVPSGDAIPLTLEYEGLADEVGGWGSPVWASRAIYDLSPAGYWRGPARRVSIDVDPGSYGSRVKVISPPEMTVHDGVFHWEGTDVDLRRQRVVIDYDGRQRGWTGGPWVRAAAVLRASASSTLAPQGKHDYAAARAVDLDPGTAWCEGAKGDGIGESLTVQAELTPSADRECRILDVELVPGLARDDAVYRANGRVTAGRLEGCDGAKGALDFSLEWSAAGARVWTGLPDDDHARLPAQEISLADGALEGTCVRLVITQVRRGRHADTCVGELIPRVYCRPRASAGGERSSE